MTDTRKLQFTRDGIKDLYSRLAELQMVLRKDAFEPEPESDERSIWEALRVAVDSNKVARVMRGLCEAVGQEQLNDIPSPEERRAEYERLKAEHERKIAMRDGLLSGFANAFGKTSEPVEQPSNGAPAENG